MSPLYVSSQSFRELFRVDDVIDSGGYKSSFRIAVIAEDYIKIQPVAAPTPRQLLMNHLSVVAQYFERIDDQNIVKSMKLLFVEHGIKSTTWSQPYVYGLIREYKRRSDLEVLLPEEIPSRNLLAEGAIRTITINAYERSGLARASYNSLGIDMFSL